MGICVCMSSCIHGSVGLRVCLRSSFRAFMLLCILCIRETVDLDVFINSCIFVDFQKYEKCFWVAMGLCGYMSIHRSLYVFTDLQISSSSSVLANFNVTMYSCVSNVCMYR